MIYGIDYALINYELLQMKFEKLLGVGVDLVSSRAITSKAMEFIGPELIYV